MASSEEKNAEVGRKVQLALRHSPRLEKDQEAMVSPIEYHD
jgi:hypothetical protein